MVNQNQALNDLLIDLCRSLLQYASEAWPWTADDEQQARRTIDQIVARQQVYIAELADILMSRGWNVDFGMYPVEYTDLHYVALGYLLNLLVENQTALLAKIEKALEAVRGDQHASELLADLLTDQREIVSTLRKLLESRPHPHVHV
jgi:hypothetical protein